MRWKGLAALLMEQYDIRDLNKAMDFAKMHVPRITEDYDQFQAEMTIQMLFNETTGWLKGNAKPIGVT